MARPRAGQKTTDGLSIQTTTLFKFAPITAGAGIISPNFRLYVRDSTLGWAATSITAAAIAIVAVFITNWFSRFNHAGSDSS